MVASSRDFFKEYAAALASFSAEKISEFYQTPLAIYSDNGVQIVNEMDEVVSFWEQGVKPYKKMDIDKAVPEALSEEQVSEKFFISKVLWKNYNKAGKEVAAETNLYILSGRESKMKISGLIIMTK